MFAMGSKTPTSWKPGQSGNPKGRPKGTMAEKLAKSPVARALGLTPADMPGRPPEDLPASTESVGPSVLGGGSQADSQVGSQVGSHVLTPSAPAPGTPVSPRKLTDPEIREGLRALMPAALLCLQNEVMAGGEKAGTAARYIMDQVVGKPTETVKHQGEGPGWQIEWRRLPDRRAEKIDH